MIFLENERSHAVLMIFLGTEDIEIAEADDLALGQGQDAADEAVELELGIGIGIQSLFTRRVFAEAILAAAIGRSRRRIEEGNLALHAVTQEILAAFVVVLHHIASVVVHRIRAGPFMEDDVDVAAVEGIVGHLFIEVGIVHIIKEIEALEVAAFAAVRQVVDDEDVVDAPVVQLFYDIAADKTGTTCYNFHSFPFFTKSAIFSISPVVE